MNRFVAICGAALFGALVAQANPGLLPWLGDAVRWGLIVSLTVLVVGGLAFLFLGVPAYGIVSWLRRPNAPPPPPQPLEEELAAVERAIAEGHPSRSRMEHLERMRTELIERLDEERSARAG